MKSKLILTLLATATVGLYAAKEEAAKAIPKEAFGVYSFEDAQKQSAKKKDPIVFLLVNERTEDAKVEGAGKIAYWGLEKDNTVVVLRPNSAGEWARRLPAALPGAINAKDLGKEYPRLVAMDHTGSVVLTSVAAAKLIDGGEDAVKTLNKEIKELAKNPPKPTAAAPATAPGATPAATPGAAPTPAPATPGGAPTAAPAGGSVAIQGASAEGWTSSDGRTIQATLLEVAADKVVLQLANGNKVDVPLAKLNDASKKRAEELKAASAK
ncbi:hypothetical protein [Verrucomicrobium sp. BvORR106]|uniref:hypothetical protein n=1 Tax=Verrucomicrobium sp. BvORR106 TaxID=1403819 RepID=UPI00056F26DF|nr:hypothetical protein [Verrucomicrobium sp. BvORR106]